MDLEKYMIRCMNKKLTGVDCMGCGTQRAFVLFLQGDFAEAFYMFPAIFTTIPLFLFIALHFIDKNRNYQKLIIGFAIANALIMIISYFYKIFNH